MVAGPGVAVAVGVGVVAAVGVAVGVDVRVGLGGLPLLGLADGTAPALLLSASRIAPMMRPITRALMWIWYLFRITNLGAFARRQHQDRSIAAPS